MGFRNQTPSISTIFVFTNLPEDEYNLSLTNYSESPQSGVNYFMVSGRNDINGNSKSNVNKTNQNGTYFVETTDKKPNSLVQFQQTINQNYSKDRNKCENEWNIESNNSRSFEEKILIPRKTTNSLIYNSSKLRSNKTQQERNYDVQKVSIVDQSKSPDLNQIKNYDNSFGSVQSYRTTTTLTTTPKYIRYITPKPYKSALDHDNYNNDNKIHPGVRIENDANDYYKLQNNSCHYSQKSKQPEYNQEIPARQINNTKQAEKIIYVSRNPRPDSRRRV